ncbi:MAG TPA: hypothetical protein VN380_18320 [Thermoanaerobaculia bacterium]|nr:hypothetical protein [Thermoanaerobaculia bacterium]
MTAPAGSDRTTSHRLPNADAAIALRLEQLTNQERDFWAFARDTRRPFEDAYFLYAAMMVPAMQSLLISTVSEVQSHVRSVLDPFAGSGTVLAETMAAGLCAQAQDINPLAVLLCAVRQGPFNIEELRSRGKAAIKRAESDKSCAIEASIDNHPKWFRPRTAVQLSRLRRSIRRTSDVSVRRFLWVTLAETVRRCSNSRTSTYKLHVRPASEIASLPGPMTTFKRVLEDNLERHEHFASRLTDAKRLRDGKYTAQTTTLLRDSRLEIQGRHDLLITSPPYGDNRTTVPYGQHAYLPLSWIDLNDIPGCDDEVLRTTYEIDRRSLGGLLKRGVLRKEYKELLGASKTLEKFARRMGDDRERLSKVLAFASDLRVALRSSLNALNSNAYLFFVLGNRRVGNVEVKLDAILSELLETEGATPVAIFDRTIPTKRMPLRNDQAATIRGERVLVLRKNP